MGKDLAEFVGATIGFILGYLVCLSMLCGAFGAGYALAHFLVPGANPDMLGLLSVITVVWLYESERANDRWNNRR